MSGGRAAENGSGREGVNGPHRSRRTATSSDKATVDDAKFSSWALIWLSQQPKQGPRRSQAPADGRVKGCTSSLVERRPAPGGLRAKHERAPFAAPVERGVIRTEAFA